MKAFLILLNILSPALAVIQIGDEDEIIQSTNYPFYTRNSEVHWNLQGKEGSRLEIICDVMALFNNNDCYYNNYLILTEGNSSRKFCTKFDKFETKGNILTIELKISSRGRLHCTVKSHFLSEIKQNSTCDCGWSNKFIRNKKKIVGGVETIPNEFPFMVGIRRSRSRSNICGGSIITNFHILSAAHCFLSGGNHEVIVGIYFSNTARQISVKQIVPHRNYNTVTNENDIALLLLATSIPFSHNVGRVCLPSKPIDLTRQFITAIGWGVTQAAPATGLRKVDLRVINIASCAIYYNNRRNLIDTNKVTQICTHERNKDSCQGDSGGPLVWLNKSSNRYTQVALVSYGRGCANGYPGVNTDVYYYMNWIRSAIDSTMPRASYCSAG